MASYKVPQDVEADDKLLGPFSFRQFVYLLVVAGCIAIAWGLAQLFIGLAIIPLPAIMLFAALALPLKKDQPMEIYLAAIISFHMKPRMRKWDPEGIESTVEISAPKVVERPRTKGFGGNEAEKRLSYLADIVDTQGWAIRSLDGSNTSMNSAMYMEAQDVADVFDINNAVAQNFNQMMAQSTERLRTEARQNMFQPAPLMPASAAPQPMQTYYQQTPSYSQEPFFKPAPLPVAPPPIAPAYTQPAPQLPPDPIPTFIQPESIMPTPSPTPSTTVAIPTPTPAPDPAATPHFDPYPDFHQSVLQPLGEANHAITAEVIEAAAIQPKETSLTTSDNDLKAGIINLANNTDLSVETIQHEADRLHKKAEIKAQKKKKNDGEVVISLR